MVKKQFFREPSMAQIRNDSKLIEVDPRDDTLVERLRELSEGEVIVLNSPLYYPDFKSSRMAMKHALDVKSHTTADQAIQLFKDAVKGRSKKLYDIITNNEVNPWMMRQAAFDNLQMPLVGGYSFSPFPPSFPWQNQDTRVRKVSLVECLEAARISAYVEQVEGVPKIKVGDYTNHSEVAKTGAVVPVKVPSRTKGEGRYTLKMTSVPIVENNNKHSIAWAIGAEGHADCGRKLWHFRYSNRPSAKEVVFCAHEIFAYRAIAEHMWKTRKAEGKKDYKTTMQMNQFVQPTSELIEVYRRTLDSVLVKDPETKDELRKTNKADEEILLWSAVMKYGSENTCFRKHGTKLGQEDWNLRYLV
ncbi:MAG: hypothetical protein Q8Q35_03490 [Nanoarchaeota archaeon]|nr:hypothetical protein [Nanoarchaeota archaeon]